MTDRTRVCAALIGCALIILNCGRLELSLNGAQASLLTLFSAHWVHLDSTHAFMNALNWIAMLWLLRIRVSRLIVVLSVAVSLGWWLFEPAMGYAGLSGVLFGLFGYQCIQWLLIRDSRLLGLGGLLVAIWLMLVGSPATPAYDFEIAVLAHGVGLTTGVLFAGVSRHLPEWSSQLRPLRDAVAPAVRSACASPADPDRRLR
jgi:membrane associated rhomboid family serine protease